MYEGKWIRYSPSEHPLFLHKGQSRKQSNVSASNKKQFHGDLRAVCQTCWPTSRGQAWTFIWRASLCICPTTSCACRPDPLPAPGQGWRTSTEQFEDKRGDLWMGLGGGETRSNTQGCCWAQVGGRWLGCSHSLLWPCSDTQRFTQASDKARCVFKTVALKWFAVLELQNIKICCSSKLWKQKRELLLKMVNYW